MGTVALGASTVTAIFWALLSIRRTTQRLARVAAILTIALLATSLAVLASDLWRVDEASAYVAQHASSDTPVAFRLAAMWGGMEGSLLTWTTVIASVFVVAYLRQVSTGLTPADESDHPFHFVQGLGVVGGCSTAAFALITSIEASPFAALDVPTGDGRGLLAVLQHPAMIYHPPILYLGLALLGPAFAMTMAALARRRLDRVWMRSATTWLRLSWIVLGIGIVTGSQWAYSELGWGGFWAWDPVENAALLPWLAVTVALHAIGAARGARVLAVPAAAAVVASFSLMVTGVYVTRSGSTGSIHAFAESPAIGRPLLALAALSALAAAVLLVRNGVGDLPRPRWNRESFLAVQVTLGFVAVAIVALGTLWPVVDGLVGGAGTPRRIVRPDFYQRTLAPLLIVAMFVMAVGPSLTFGRLPWTSNVLPRTLTASAIGGVAAGVAARLLADAPPLPTAVAVAAGFALGSTISISGTAIRSARPFRRIGMAMAHGGFALVMLAAVIASTGDDRTFLVQVGATTAAGDWTVELDRLETGRTDRYEFVRAVVVVDVGTGPTTHETELRAYDDQPTPTAESAVDGSVRGDTIVVLESIRPDLGAASLTVRSRPAMPWVWVGAAVAILGGIVTLADRRRASAAAPSAMPGRSAAATPR